MGFFDRFKQYNRGEEKKERKMAAPKSEVETVKGEKKVAPTGKKVVKKTASKVVSKTETPATSETKIEQSDKARKEDTGDAYRILLRPLVTEKATNLASENKYVFEVSPDANKVEVRKAIKNVYGLNPVSVNILNVSGKKIRFGKTSGRTKNKKKAIVAFKKGEKIEVYEGI